VNVRTTPATVDTAISELRARVACRVVTPAEPDYEALRQIVYGGIEGHPAAIVRVHDATDVSRTILVAQETGVPLAIRSGGHSGAGHSTVDDGIVLDVREMNELEIDPVTRTMWAEAGATALEVTAKAAEHGLAIGFGDTGSVGIAGITLGGGVGYLGRKHGLTIDNLLAADIVTADGQLRLADADTNPDLFWAIRGGGGNFGVVTRFQYRLHELPAAVGGFLILPATVETITGFIAAAEAAPDELSTIANVMPAPPMPGVPEDVVGSMVIFGALVCAAPIEDGERELAPFRELAKPIGDMLRPVSPTDMYPPEDDSYHPKAASRTMFMDHIGRPEAETILSYLNASDASLRVAQLRVLGGAIARVPDDATAYAHRQSRIMVNVAAFWEGPEDRPIREDWVRDLSAALQQDDEGAYVNFLLDESPERIRAAYPGTTWARLREIKAIYDPRNVFSRNQNIPPSGA
jgi:FAD/FMN-containing dehydrogenase